MSSACHLAVDISLSLGIHQQGNDQAVKAQDFGENEDKDHSDEKTRLLSCAADSSITHNSDGEAGSKTRQANREAGTELDEAGEKGLLLRKVVGDQHRNHEAVDTNDTGHNNRDNVCLRLSGPRNTRVGWKGEHTLDDKIRSKNTHGRDTDTRLCSSVCRTKAGEDNG